jgi:hypothetical protein
MTSGGMAHGHMVASPSVFTVTSFLKPQYLPLSSSTMSDPITLSKALPQLVFTSALSSYGLYLSYQNITRLQQYEKQSEKAAEWSNTAAQRLSKTRSTQASGTISVRLIIISQRSHRVRDELTHSHSSSCRFSRQRYSFLSHLSGLQLF